MSERLDDLARRLAEPMPRRRALRTMLAGAGAAMVSSLQPERASARRRIVCPSQDDPCGQRCCPAGTFCADAAMSACCQTGFIYCPGTPPREGTCCNPGSTCVPHGGCCPPGSAVCGDTCCFDGEVCGNAAQDLCCAPDVEACGTVCCEKGQTCADASKSFCCAAHEDPCYGPRGSTCCGPEHACCKGECCAKHMVCHDGRCKKCPKDWSPCGDEECCPPGVPCCGSKCCFGGDVCARAGGEKTCCPPERVLTQHRGGRRRGGLFFCCPEGTVPKRGVCCPREGKCDRCSGEIPCLPGTVCVDGDCRAM